MATLLLLLLAFSALSSAFRMQMMDIDVEKRSANDSGTEVPDVHKVGVLTFR